MRKRACERGNQKTMKTSVTPEEFVNEFWLLKQNHLKSILTSSEPASYAAFLLQKLNLSVEQQATATELLDAVITDVLYTVLLGLDGETQIGNKQVFYNVLDEQGNKICGVDATGEVEAIAYKRFHTK
jgi:hypothetical protein